MKVFHLSDFDACLRYLDLPGTGVPILFIHGYGCGSSCDFPPVAADPTLAGRRCLLVDLLGSGYSDRPQGFSYTMAAHARTLDALLDALGLPLVDLYGHSMGGAVAIELASLRPGRVRRFVASEPALDAGGGDAIRAAAALSEDEYMAHGHGDEIRKAVAEQNPVWAGTLAASSPMAIHREARARMAGTWRAQLEALPMPRTILFGQRSLPHPDTERHPAVGIAIAVIPDAGHSMMWENPAALAQALARALA